MPNARWMAVLLAVLTLGAAFPVAAAPRAGVAAAVRGKVTLEREKSVGVAIQTGAQIYLGDRIVTGPDAGLQVLLLDESVFTLGPSSALVVDRFVYDPKGDTGELETELVRGAFRFVSGRIAKRDPTKMNVKLPAGTIGVRGTIVGASVDPNTGRSLVWLAGPSAGNNAGIPAGSISVENAGVTRDVERSGWGVEIPDFATPPSPPFQVPDTAYGTLAFEVTPDGGAEEEEEEDADSAPAGEGDASPGTPQGESETAGPAQESTAEGTSVEAPLEILPGGGEGVLGGEVAASFETQLSERLSTFDSVNRDQAQMMASTESPAAPFTPTSLMDLISVSSGFDGHFLFALENVPLQSGGDADVLVDLDFDQDVVGVQLVELHSQPLLTLGFGAGATSVPFGSAIGGEAKFVVQFPYIEPGAGLCVNGCAVTLQTGFLNIPTQVAGQLQLSGQIGTVSVPIETLVPQDVPITLIFDPSMTTAP